MANAAGSAASAPKFAKPNRPDCTKKYWENDTRTIFSADDKAFFRDECARMQRHYDYKYGGPHQHGGMIGLYGGPKATCSAESQADGTCEWLEFLQEDVDAAKAHITPIDQFKDQFIAQAIDQNNLINNHMQDTEQDRGASHEAWQGKNRTEAGVAAHRFRVNSGFMRRGDDGAPRGTAAVVLNVLDVIPVVGTMARLTEMGIEAGNHNDHFKEAGMDAGENALFSLIPGGTVAKGGLKVAKTGARLTSRMTEKLGSRIGSQLEHTETRLESSVVESATPRTTPIAPLVKPKPIKPLKAVTKQKQPKQTKEVEEMKKAHGYTAEDAFHTPPHKSEALKTVKSAVGQTALNAGISEGVSLATTGKHFFEEEEVTPDSEVELPHAEVEDHPVSDDRASQHQKHYNERDPIKLRSPTGNEPHRLTVTPTTGTNHTSMMIAAGLSVPVIYFLAMR